MNRGTKSPLSLGEVAEALAAAERDRVAVDPPSRLRPGLTVAEAYEIQSANIALRSRSGERRIGHKIGLTSPAMQQQLGIDQPDFGVLTDRMVIANAGSLRLDELIAPKVEAEFAFRLGEDLPVAPSSVALASAIDGVAVALEVIDSRVADWRIGLVDTIADNASSARIVHADFVPATPELIAGLPEAVITLDRDGVPVTGGSGAAVLGHPLTALEWLAAAIGRFGGRFSAGDVVLAGAVAQAAPLDDAALWSARSSGLPPVRLRVKGRKVAQ